MLYAALTFWILVAVLLAWGVRELLLGLTKPKVLNAILLPGTLAGMIGHVVGLLMTGSTVRDTTLFKDDESGEPGATPDPKPRIPILGPIIIAMLPLVACAAAIQASTRYLGRGVVGKIKTDIIGPSLPTTLADFWQMLRDLVTLTESVVVAILRADLTYWPNLLFVYLLVCLTIRMAPFPGTLRGALGAILLLGGAAAITTSLFAVDAPSVTAGWAVLNITIGCLLLLLIVSLLLRGAALVISFVRERETHVARGLKPATR
jgi:hypothetical protein